MNHYRNQRRNFEVSYLSSENKIIDIFILLGQSITCIELLSNEIFYEIFDHFNGAEIAEAFSNLNSRFEQLLHFASL